MLSRASVLMARAIWPGGGPAVCRGLRLAAPPAGARLCRPSPLTCAPFTTSTCRRASPLVWLVVRPVTKFMAVVFGRSFRKWWRALPSDKRAVCKASLRRNWARVLAGVTAGAALSLHYYYTHLEETPITGRTRFLAFTSDQMAKISREHYQEMTAEYDENVLPPHHPAHRTVVRVTNRLVSANGQLLRHHQWNVTVVDNEQVNAFALPCGNIFVFTGMLEKCRNDDQLGCILGHELAHTVLGHGAENISRAHLLDLLLVLPLAAIWALLPNDGVSAFAHWFFRQVVSVMGDLPYSRQLESEADLVGLQLAAKACFDVREASVFWAVAAFSQSADGADPEWLSTHPAHAGRQQAIEQQLPELQRTREQCQCGPLPYPDPRQLIRQLQEQAAATGAVTAWTGVVQPTAPAQDRVDGG